MEPLLLTIPPEAVAAARLPRQGMEAEFLQRLAAALYTDGILPGGVACRMAGMEKAEWHDYLGRHRIPHPLTDEDVAQDLQNLLAWKESSASSAPPSSKEKAPTGFVAKWSGSVKKIDDPSDDWLTHLNEKHIS